MVPLQIVAVKTFIELYKFEERRWQAIRQISAGVSRNSNICLKIAGSLQKNDPDSYTDNYLLLSSIYEKYAAKQKRDEILAKIEAVAPDWASEINDRSGIHGGAKCPENIFDAWKWKQFVGILDDITAEPYEKLQLDAVEFSQDLRKKTTELVEYSAWYHLLLRTETNLDMKQALQGWKQTVRRIGRGTGRNAPMLKKKARELMTKCQVAVPAWIMTSSKALESLNPSQNRFDIIIIDEASQSDVSALAIMYMANKVIIVGDDKQVSPLAVGQDINQMNALREMFIKDVIPNWHLFDAKTSLYDIAGTTYQPLMLREHFRCVPEIIGYSNKLSYDYKIKPLRDASKCNISPAIISFRVDGQRENFRKLNKTEAEQIVALMMACMEQDEYIGKTFGVISLLGDEQAKLIYQYLSEKIEPAVIDQRKIMCGNASHFQGDERDVIFLSMVDSNEGDGPLRMTGEGADQSTKQRYNVAVSRARDQLWVIHSLDYTRDLKSGDLRRDLLEYADNPTAFMNLADEVVRKAESPFEEAVGKALISAGYHIEQQWQIGSYRIDMVVLYRGNKIAVECDGEQYHSGEDKVRADMERQTILERLGWRFIRIRGSEYYRAPQATIGRVILELNTYGIYPENPIAVLPDEQTADSLLTKVKQRAAQLLSAWHQDMDDAYEHSEQPDSGVKIDHQDHLKNNVSHQPVATKALNTEHETKSQLVNQDLKKSMDYGTKRASDETYSGVKEHLEQKQKQLPASQKSLNGRRKTNRTVKLNDNHKGDDLLEVLPEMNFKCIDNRGISGIIWVLYNQEQEEHFEILMSGFGYQFSFERRGSVATSYQPAWRVMIR